MTLRPFATDDLLRMRGVGNVALAPDGNEFIYVQTEVFEKENTYVSSVHRYLDRKVKPFTNQGGQKKVRDHQPAYSPDGRHIAFLSNRSGRNQVWVIDRNGGEAQRLTDVPTGVTSLVWAPDSKGIYFTAKEGDEPKPLREGATARRINTLRYKFNGVGYYDGRHSQIWFVDLKGEQRQITEGPYNAGQPSPSPCGRFLAFVSNRSKDELETLDDLWLLELATGALRNLTNGGGMVRGPAWVPFTTCLLYVGHQKGVYPGAYPEVREIDVISGDDKSLTPGLAYYIGNTVGADIRFDSGNTQLALSVCGRLVYFVGTEGGNSYLFRLDRMTGQLDRVFGSGQMCITSYAVAGKRLAVTVSTPATPGDIWYGQMDTDLERVTEVNAELFADKFISWPEVVHFCHPDGTTLEGWLLKPIGYREGERYPLVMQIHGGPHATYGNAFFHEFQILAGQGMGVFYTNPRGSLGYGEEFSRACVGDWCGVDARDLQFMAEEAAKLPWVDEQRIGVTGGSQGGYFTNWLVSHTDMFAAAVTQRSMSNLYSKYGVSDIGWFGDKAGMGGRDLWDDEDFIMERSPIRYARNVKTPTLIIHSDEDYRCPLEQAEQWYVALRRLGVPTEMLIFHGENHELSRSGRPANRIVRLEGIMDWFKRYLG